MTGIDSLAEQAVTGAVVLAVYYIAIVSIRYAITRGRK